MILCHTVGLFLSYCLSVYHAPVSLCMISCYTVCLFIMQPYLYAWSRVLLFVCLSCIRIFMHDLMSFGVSVVYVVRALWPGVRPNPGGPPFSLPVWGPQVGKWQAVASVCSVLHLVQSCILFSLPSCLLLLHLLLVLLCYLYPYLAFELTQLLFVGCRLGSDRHRETRGEGTDWWFIWAVGLP